MIKVLLASFVALIGLTMLPGGLGPLLVVPVWLIWEVSARVDRLRFSRDVQREWELLVDS
ncbi:hypothetical protein E3T37_07570 [Cryobacterium sp. TMT2-10]|uniref:hypothetical protein n=1 Tax=unclassified Cryobacterium TaxID=2649013 RepID=UPI00106DB9CA|nr:MULTISPECIES: hypothetical protein [unclassified Cryobacterium]TFC86628.1 hypothetical protein E3T24_06450 [Cryobacterium sp. TmT2-59]TFD15610.1 hypothetical protein E3T42_10300 [Cryobacterium sp. TMT4-10]TFD39609.1 hypothetical protein E3T37_07570 [Cryobacterium sp. TMT2-10]